MKVRVVCPSRGRPDRLVEMLRSFYATRSQGTEVLIYVDARDPRVEEYRRIPAGPGHRIEFGPRWTIVEVFNTAATGLFSSAHYDYYVDCNDDFIFHTPAWDLKLKAALDAHGGIGCAYGRTRNLPSCAMFSARSIRALGWWFPIGFTHQYVDNVQRDLYAAAEQLYFVPDVIIEHRHPAFDDRVPWDDTYEHVYSGEVGRRDAAAYGVWTRERMAGDVATLKRLKPSDSNSPSPRPSPQGEAEAIGSLL